MWGKSDDDNSGYPENTADEEKAATALAAFARENPEALETIIKANQLFLEKFAPSGGENLYNAYRETARAYKKKNLIQSNYPYDSQNYAEAAAYYLKAAETAPDAGRKLSSLDGAASMYWNLDDKKQWCRVKLQQVPSVSDKDKTRLYMDIARETADKNSRKSCMPRLWLMRHRCPAMTTSGLKPSIG